jgi:site-specific DNA recombinase
MPAANGGPATSAARVVLYARVSSKEQREEGYSIEAQLRLLRDYAVKHAFVISEEFIDVESRARAAGRDSTRCLRICESTPPAE